jgi:hypothetical protein
MSLPKNVDYWAYDSLGILVQQQRYQSSDSYENVDI